MFSRVRQILELLVALLVVAAMVGPAPMAAATITCDPTSWPQDPAGHFDVSGADLSGCVLPDALDLYQARAVGTNFDGVVAHGLYVGASDLLLATFRNADLAPSAIRPSTFKGSILRDADFTNATLAGVVFEADHLGGVSFRNADFATISWGSGSVCPDYQEGGSTCAGHLGFIRKDATQATGYVGRPLTLTGEAYEPEVDMIPSCINAYPTDSVDSTVPTGPSIGQVAIDETTGTWTWTWTPPEPVSRFAVLLVACDYTATNAFEVLVYDPPSVAAPTFGGSLVEGSPVVASATFADPAAGQTFSCFVTFGDGSPDVPGTVSDHTCTAPAHEFLRPDTYWVRVVVSDGLAAGEAYGEVTISNAAPTILSFTSPPPVRVGNAAMSTVTFSDPGTTESYVLSWTWSNGATVTQYFSSGGPGGVTTATAGFNPGQGGVYTVTVTVDDGIDRVTATAEVVVYDPARTVSGKGTVVSPAGACTLTVGCGVAGTASFSVSARYARNATVPTASFTFAATGLSLTAASASWLAAAGENATLQGTATVNRVGGYTFRLIAVDGRPGQVRLQVWDAANVLVYDIGRLVALRSGTIMVK